MSTELDTYEITQEESLQFQLLQSNIDKAALNLQLARERLGNFQTYLAGKYSEYGDYELVGELNLETRQGKRRKADADFDLGSEGA